MNNFLETVNINKMKLFVNTIEFGIIELLVRNDEMIKEIKQNIHGKRGLNVNLLNLYYNGEILEDEKTLDKYEIINNSIIDIVNKLSGGMRIFVENNEKIFAFEIDENEKIINAKLKILKSMGIDDKYFYLIYNDKIFDGDENLIEFGISNKSLINVERNEMHIFAKTMDGQTCVFEVEYFEKVIDLKYKIQELIGLHPNEQQLIYLTNLLDDDKSIDEYQICDQSVINITARLIVIQIFVNESKFTIYVYKSNKIKDVKNEIKKKIDLHQNDQMIYKDFILEDEKTINDYQISDQSEINIINKSKIKILINIDLFDGRKFKLCAEKQTKIIDIKKKIEFLVHLHLLKQNLYYQGVLLEENEIALKEIKTSSEGTSQNANKKSIIKKLLKSKERKPSNIEMTISVESSDDWLEIFVERPNAILNKLCVFKRETILDVKWKINQLVSVKPDEQILYYNESILDDNKTVEESNIVDKAVLHVEFNLKSYKDNLKKNLN